MLGGDGMLKKTRNKEIRTGLAFILPALIYMLLIVGYPLVYNIVLSFKDLSVMNINSGDVKYVGFDNYVTLWKSGVLPIALKNTFIFTIASIFFQFSLGLLLALFFKKKFRLAGTVRGLILVIWVIPATVVAMVFKFMFQTDGGLINAVLMGLRLIREPVQWLTNGRMALVSVIITNIWYGMPFNMILLTAGLNAIPQHVYESAKIDGATGFKSFKHITLPLLKPTILSVLVLGVIYTFKVFDIVYVMTKGGPVNATQLLSTYSYTLSLKEYQFSQGAAAANVLFLCLAIVAVFYLRLMKNEDNT